MVVDGVMGFLVAYLNIPSIVVTLGMLSILKGGLIMATGGAWICNLPPGYALAQMEPLGIAMPIWFMVVLTVGAAFWMRYSGLGRAIYAVGGNAEAARLAGISGAACVLQVFLIHGAFAGIASVLFATQLSVIQSTVPPNLELTIITASVVGGVSILGGIGSVVGSTLAAILLARDRQLADLPQRLALLDPGRAGRADPGRPCWPTCGAAAARWSADGRRRRRPRALPAFRLRPGGGPGRRSWRWRC